MTRRQLALIALTVLIACSLSALIAYRLGLRRTSAPFAPPSAPRGATGSCVDFQDAGSQTGKTGCITGRVLRVFTSRAGNTFLDFCPDYRTCSFASVIFAADRSKFGDLQTLAGQQVEIRGPATVYQGRAEIIIHNPEQIRVLP